MAEAEEVGEEPKGQAKPLVRTTSTQTGLGRVCWGACGRRGAGLLAHRGGWGGRNHGGGTLVVVAVVVLKSVRMPFLFSWHRCICRRLHTPSVVANVCWLFRFVGLGRPRSSGKRWCELTID